MSESIYSVMLLEDEAPTRKGLVSLINAHERLSLMGEAETVAEAITILEQQAPDVLLADIGLPDGSGIDVIRTFRERYPQMEAMVLTVFGDEESVVSALEAGATGYLLKDQALDDLGESIISLMNGESAISPKVARYLLKRFSPDARHAKQTNREDETHLTARESEVLMLISKGYSYNEIGENLELSTNTIRAHIRSIYRKLAVRSRSEAVFEAAQLGLIQLDNSHF